MPHSTVTSKGQTTIPGRIRKALRIKPGDKLEYVLEGDHITVRVHLGTRSLQGALAGKKGKGMSFAEIRQAAVTTDICYVTWYGRMKDGYQSDVSCDVGTLVGGNMSMQRDILHEIGYFDANYIGTSIFEEQDISERLKNMGYRIHFTNETTIVHQPQNNGNVNLQNIDTSQYYYNFNHNEILYFLKNRNHLLLLFVIPFCILRAFKKTIQFHLSVSESCRILYGIVDGVKKYHHSLKL